MSLVLAVVVAVIAPPAVAEIVASYNAVLGPKDRIGAKGKPLSQPWQILLQDRTNYHRYGISQAGDEWDPYFASINNRKTMRALVKNGSISQAARKRILNGGSVQVQVISKNGKSYVAVAVGN